MHVSVAMVETLSANLAVKDILRSVESLLVGSGGRPLLQALHFGGVARLSRKIAAFLNYGAVHRDLNGGETCAPFLRATCSPDLEDVVEWITEKIVESSLSEGLRIITKDFGSLQSHYDGHAYVRQKAVVQGLVDGLRYLDEQDLAGLAEFQLYYITHRDTAEGTSKEAVIPVQCDSSISVAADDSPSSSAEFNSDLRSNLSNSCPCLTDEQGVKQYVVSQDWFEPTVEDAISSKDSNVLGARPKVQVNHSSKDNVPDESVKSPVKNSAQRRVEKSHKRSESDTIIQRRHAALTTRVDSLKELKVDTHSVQPRSFQSYEFESDNSWSEVVPPSSGWQFPKPESTDQSLYSYIISGHFSKHQAPLDQDNAHLILAEAVIFSSGSDISRTLSNQNIGHSKKTNGGHIEELDYTNRTSPGPFANHENKSEHSKSRNKGDLVLSDGNHVKYHSAEATALRLLLTLENPHQPKASELIHVISGEEHTTEPLQDSLLNTDDVREDDDLDDSKSDFGQSTELRGTLYWAPPRPQLILKVHNKPSNVRAAMRQQNYFCNDCGVSVDTSFAHTFRFCHYFGKYACTSCHTNASHVLPANIIEKWDFKEYKVSNFALKVLTRLSNEPLFSVMAVNPMLVKRVAKLRTALSLREQAQTVAKYVNNCRFASVLKEDILECLSIQDPATVSLNELCSIKLGVHGKTLKKQIDLASDHIFKCQLCLARGFICEGCRSKEVIFPFQRDEVYQCQNCFACYHNNCFKNLCTKCQRKTERSLSRLNIDDDQ